ncbi:TadE/TadG family type IV pilus assembly protein [Streptomyces sp. SM12]|uniref:TadE/TadG family type IV pilus assembly protein n=1 Tax=Streptomyces sp. SM12 TaxID=1071602 RepID=UPI000CD4E420|nr:TadE family protein [Streptomyces sp. SM12]
MTWGQRGQRVGAYLRQDRGGGALELAILTPAIFLLIFGAIQAMMLAHGRNVAQSAAQRGVEIGRSYDASPGAGAGAAREFLGHMGEGALRSTTVTTSGSTGTTVRITVTGRVPSLVPGMRWNITQAATGPRERLS